MSRNLLRPVYPPYPFARKGDNDYGWGCAE